MYNRRGAHDRFYAWEKEKDARGKAGWGKRDEERERERKRQSRRGNGEGRGKMGETRLQKEERSILNRDVALQVGVRPSGCRSSGELVEESTLQR